MLLVKYICTVARPHSGVESFDPVRYGGQPCSRHRGHKLAVTEVTSSNYPHMLYTSQLCLCSCSSKCAQTTGSCNQFHSYSKLWNSLGFPKTHFLHSLQKSHRIRFMLIYRQGLSPVWGIDCFRWLLFNMNQLTHSKSHLRHVYHVQIDVYDKTFSIKIWGIFRAGGLV